MFLFVWTNSQIILSIIFQLKTRQQLNWPVAIEKYSMKNPGSGKPSLSTTMKKKNESLEKVFFLSQKVFDFIFCKPGEKGKSDIFSQV
jgi:hypothetical protein